MEHNTSRFRLFFGCLSGALLIAGAAFLLGLIPLPRGHDSARPPCEGLPPEKMVADALASHGDLASRILAAGPGVKIEIATPCADQPERAILRIRYTTEAEWKMVDAILTQDGFGVDVELVRH